MDKEIRNDVGQLLWVGFQGSTLPRDMERALRNGQFGALVIFSINGNIPYKTPDFIDVDALVALTNAIHFTGRSAPAPIFVAVDQEGGRVQRIRAPATVWPAMGTLDHLEPDDAVQAAAKIGAAIGKELAGLGFDINFAPVLDIHTNPSNPIIGDRAFGTTPGDVADRALAFAAAMQKIGILPCGKHFPGHGDTITDSHLQLPRIDHKKSRLQATELLPFARATQTKLPLIMTAHIVFSDLDPDTPATLSHRILQQLLREQMQFQGVIVSDDLDMDAIASNYDVGEAAVQAIESGCDALLICRRSSSQIAAYEALLQAATKRSSFRDRVAAAATAIRRLKAQYFATPIQRSSLRSTIGCPPHRTLAASLRNAIRSSP